MAQPPNKSQYRRLVLFIFDDGVWTIIQEDGRDGTLLMFGDSRWWTNREHFLAEHKGEFKGEIQPISTLPGVKDAPWTTIFLPILSDGKPR